MLYIKNINLILLGILYLSSAYSSENINNRIAIDLHLGKEGNINPEFFFPLNWTDHWYSGISFKNSNQLAQRELDGFSDSKLSTGINERSIQLNVINYEDSYKGFKYSIGTSISETSIDKSEFGYFYFNNGVIDEFVAFDNTIEIDVAGLSIHGDVFFNNSKKTSRYRISAELSPSNTLKVQQETSFKPIVPATGHNNSSETQGLAYALKFESSHDVNSIFKAGINIKYEVLPLKYDLKVLATTADSFQSAVIDTEETSTKIGLRIVFNHELVAGLHPVIGISSENKAIKDKISGQSENNTETLYSIGFTGEF